MAGIWHYIVNSISGFITPTELRSVGESLLTIVVILVVSGLALRAIDITVGRILAHDKGKLLPISEQRTKTIRTLLRSVSRYVVYFIAGVMILTELGADPTSLITTAGILGLAVGFGAQNLVRDVITGFFILFEDQFAVGDYIKTSGVSGVVEEVGLRATKLRDWGGELHTVPNGLVTQVTNFSRGQMRALVDVSILYEEDVDRAINLISQVGEEIAGEFPTVIEGPTVLGVVEFRERDLLIRVVARTEPMEQWAVERELRRRIKQAFDREGIKMSNQNSLWWADDRKKGDPGVEG